MNDCVLALMLKKKIPLTQRSYIELAYIGDKHSIEELGVEEIAVFSASRRHTTILGRVLPPSREDEPEF
jgi:hypothetical protein